MDNVFGREFDKKVELSSTLDEYEDMMLFFLEDFLFHFKLEPKKTYISIPALGISYETTKKYALRDYLYLPQISFDDYGCLYTNGDESAYISPEFFAKCFLQRIVDVHNAFLILDYPNDVMKNKDKKDENIDVGSLDDSLFKFKSHVNFIEIYNKIIEQKRKNNDLTKGLIGIVPDLHDRNYITNLRKIQFAAEVQSYIEKIINEIRQQEFEHMLFEYNEDDFYQSNEFKKLEEEHNKLFRSGPFIAPIEMPEWEKNNWNYDEGTDEERDDWVRKYNKAKEIYYKKGILKIKGNINKKKYSFNYLNKEVIDFLKVKIVSSLGNEPGYIDEFGLDKTAYYSHPTNKLIPELLTNKRSFSTGRNISMNDLSADYYDEFYDYAGEFIDNNNNNDSNKDNKHHI